MENKTLFGVDDGLAMNEDVGSWSAEKYGAVRLYSQIFTSSMKEKWKALTFLDLYSGAGQSRLKGTGEILLGSPLIALSLDVQFDHYIFCEEDATKLSALRLRVGVNFPTADVKFIQGDCNEHLPEIVAAIPAGALSLCFVDPYRLDIQFETIRALAKGRNIDFLCLLASRMDAGRNSQNYTKEERTEVDSLLGSSAWREDWERIRKEHAREPNFGDFICEAFARQMETLGYLPTPRHEMKSIKRDDGLLLYHLALFAKNDKAKKFWAEASTYSHSQRPLF